MLQGADKVCFDETTATNVMMHSVEAVQTVGSVALVALYQSAERHGAVRPRNQPEANRG
jgi:hypothetical protein